MFEETPFHQPQVLPIGNYLKGGDFMVEAIDPDKGRVPDSRKDPTFPMVVGRTRAIPTALEIAETIGPTGQPIIDPVVFNSVSRMDAGE